jgi:hypothetical protein
MRKSTLVVSALVAVTGPFAAVAAYQSWAPTPSPVTTVAASPEAVAATAVVRLRPCGPRAQLRHGVCVRHRVQTVVVPVASIPLEAPAAPAPTRAPDGWQPSHHQDDSTAPSTGPGDEHSETDEDEPDCAGGDEYGGDEYGEDEYGEDEYGEDERTAVRLGSGDEDGQDEQGAYCGDDDSQDDTAEPEDDSDDGHEEDHSDAPEPDGAGAP